MSLIWLRGNASDLYGTCLSNDLWCVVAKEQQKHGRTKHFSRCKSTIEPMVNFWETYGHYACCCLLGS